MNRFLKFVNTLSIGLGLACVAAIAVLQLKFPPVEGYRIQRQSDARFAQLDPWAHSALLDESRPVEERYEELFRYFLAGFLAYRSADGAYAFYPGAPSNNGRQVDGLEGFARIAPLIAAWLHGGREPIVSVPTFGEVDLPELLRRGIEAGTHPALDSYWGDIAPRNQRVVEAADIALALWLTKDVVWADMNEPTRAHVAAWLGQAEGKARGARHANWHLFPMLVNRVLKDLDMPASDEAFARDWQIVRASYAGDGWFRDGEHSGFDYYNAWSFHYALYWLSEIDPQFEQGFVSEARGEFVQFYRHLFTARGLPIFGRSICYRTAATTPLVIAALSEPQTISPGEARRALDRAWRYFANHGALTDGVLTQGYCGPDLRILDRYSGPASCLWGTRSLVAAFTAPRGSAFWTVPEEPLPVEQGDFDITAEGPGLRLIGDQATGSVTLQRQTGGGAAELEPYGRAQRSAEWLFMRPFRPANRKAKYNRAEYRSDTPFCGCAPPTGSRLSAPAML